MSTQTELFEPTIAQRFEAWKGTSGGRFCLQKLYVITARYYAVWEQLRYHLDEVRVKLKGRGQALDRERGFWLNDHFTAHAVRHMIERRPEWKPLFELREIGKERFKRKVMVITEHI